MRSLTDMEVAVLVISLVVSFADVVSPTLRLVNLVYRHGDRSPVSNYPNNPTHNSTWPDGLGWLTSDGARMHFSLGRFLRRRYSGFLNPHYSMHELKVDSSGVDRCLMSAQSNLAGLYMPENETERWNPHIPWNPIPIHTRPVEEDNMLAIRKPCPKYDDIYYGSLTQDRVLQLEADNKDFLDFISEKSGMSVNVDNLWEVSDTLYCEQLHHISPPAWLNYTVSEKLRELELWAFENLYHDKEESRFKGGPLLKKWISLADKKRKDDTYTIRMNMFSAHDSTVLAFLDNLGVFDWILPPYTACVMMELHEDPDGEYFLELFYRNRTSQDPDDDTQPYQLILPGCEPRCPFQQFVTLTKDDVPTDWDAECQMSPQTSVNTESDTDYKQAFTITVAVCSVAVVLLVVIGSVGCCKRTGRRNGGVV